MNTLLTDASYAEHVAFWTTALATMPEDFHVRQPWLSYPVEIGDTIREACPVSPAAAAVVADLSRGQALGVLVVAAGALSYLLHVCTNGTVIALDAPQLGGAGPEDRDLVPLIARVDAASTVRDHLAAVGDVVANSYSFQPFPVTQLSEVLRRRPRPTTNVLVTVDGLHAAAADAGPHDLRVSIATAPALAIVLQGRAPAFSAEYLRVFARHLDRVLEAFGDRSRLLGDIDVMGDEERHRLLVEYNATGAAATPGATIHQAFREQVARAGSAEAIRLGDATVTYSDLSRTANRLARCLQADYDIRPGDVVGVVTHRAPQTIAAILAVLEAGAVYLPIDPDYPAERLQFMVADAAVKVLLVQSEHFDRLGMLYETPMFALDLQLDSLETSDAALESRVASTDPAYIIYTSGSTGQPKAVVLEHGGFVSMIRHHIDAFAVTPADRLLQFYALSFDSSLFEIFVSLLSGATLVMADPDTVADPDRLSSYIEGQGVTTLTLPPVYLGTLDRERLTRVRRYISAGDHCRVADALAFAHTADYYNSYGPTETSVCVTHYRVDPQRRYGSRIPIGRPIAGTAIYLLDERLKPVPEGVVGEICVGGAGLARGYLNRDDLTAEAFVHSPFLDAGRLYRTGDVGAWLPDGTLEVIGRRDNQVKIRGYRIELGEIEAVLDQYPLVRESAVIAREDDTGHRRLAAYVTTTGPVDVDALKALLRTRLPEFMMPSAFVVLDRMPMTANGKIDRKALPSTAGSASAPDPSAGQPRNATEESLARIWREVLGVERVGVDDNLFDLGGDSILIIQIVARARDAGLKLAPNQLFKHQTVAALAEVALVAAPGSDAAADQESVEGAAPLTPMQAWFFEQRFAEPHHFNQSALLDVPDETDAAFAEGATRAVILHHDALRLTFAERGGQPTAEYAAARESVPFDSIDFAGTDTSQLEAAVRAAIAHCQSGFDLSSGPLIRVRLLRLGPGRGTRLLVVAHHLAIDGVSWRIVLADLYTAYSQLARGEAVSLPAKTVSYRAWAADLAERAAVLAEDLSPSSARSYWMTGEDGDTEALPTDHTVAAGANSVASARDVTRTLDLDTTTALLQDVPRAYATEINDVLLAALALAFRWWTGRDCLSIDLEGHGREDLGNDLDTSRTVGWFTSQFPVRLRLGSGEAPGDAIRAVKEQLRAVPQRGAPYGVLRYLSSDEHVVSRLRGLRQPDVLFNYLGQAGRVLAPELGWTVLPGSAGLDVSPRAARPHLLEVNGIVLDGRLTLTWTFSEAAHRRDTIEDLAAGYESALRRLIDHCRTIDVRQYTPSDFPGARLDQQSLDALVAKINR